MRISGRQQRLIAADIDFVRIAVVDENVSCGHTHGADSRNDLADNLGRRTASRRSGGVDLDADNVFRFDKFRPSIVGRGLAGQCFHCLLELALHDRLRDAVSDDRRRVANLDDTSGKQSGHAEGGRLVVRQAMQFDRGRSSRNRIRTHHRIQPLHEQRSASDTTDFDESTTIHNLVQISLCEIAGLTLEESRSDYACGFSITTLCEMGSARHRMVTISPRSGYTFAFNTNNTGAMQRRMKTLPAMFAALAITSDFLSSQKAQTPLVMICC